MKIDERALLIAIADGETPRAAVARLGMAPGRARYLLEGKWSTRDLYESGVVYDLGWLTAKGYELAESVR